MQQANYAPQVVDWFSEEYSPQFAQQTAPESNGDLVLMSATAAYEEASANPGLQLMESWMNRVAARLRTRTSSPSWPGRPAGLRAGGQGGPAPTSPGSPHHQAPGHHQLDGDGVTPPVNIGAEDPVEVLLLHEDRERDVPAGLPDRAQHLRLQQRLPPVLADRPPDPMHEFLEFTIIGIVLGAAYAVAASGLVVTYATSGIFNIAHGAIGMFMAFVYWQLSVGWHINTGARASSSPSSSWPRSSGAVSNAAVIQWMDPHQRRHRPGLTVGLTLLLFGLVKNYIWKPTARVRPAVLRLRRLQLPGRARRLGGGHHGRRRPGHRHRSAPVPLPDPHRHRHARRRRQPAASSASSAAGPAGSPPSAGPSGPRWPRWPASGGPAPAAPAAHLTLLVIDAYAAA